MSNHGTRYGFLFFLGLLSLFLSSPSFAETKGLFDSILRNLGEEVAKQVGGELSKSLNENTRGFCQIWKGNRLALQKACGRTEKCDSESSNCTIKLVWPNNGVTTVETSHGVFSSLNGKRTRSAKIGTDLCLEDGDGTFLCYTTSRQSAELAWGGYVNDTGAALDQSQSLNGGDNGASAIKSAELVPGGLIQNGAVTKSTTDAKQTQDANTKIESVLNQYIEAMSASSNSRTSERCNLGAQLLQSRSFYVTADLRSSISEQMQRDNCGQPTNQSDSATNSRAASSTQQEPKVYTEGLEPVGTVRRTGCEDIEVIGYSQKTIADTVWQMILRNNGKVERLVRVYIHGGLSITGRRTVGDMDVRVGAGQMQTVHLDYSANHPDVVQIKECR